MPNTKYHKPLRVNIEIVFLATIQYALKMRRLFSCNKTIEGKTKRN